MKRLRKVITFALAAVMTASMLFPTLEAKAATYEFKMGKNHPDEVVATVDSDLGTVTLSMNYHYDATKPAEYPYELPNPGLMADGVQTELINFLQTNGMEGLTLIISPGVKSIGENAFAGTRAFESVVNNSDDLKSIGSNAFSGNDKLKDVIINSPKLEAIKANTFSDCTNLSKITITEFITDIESRAFANTGIEEVSGGNALTNVAPDAFSGAKKIKLSTTSPALTGYDWTGNGYEAITLSDGSSLFTVTFDTGLSGVTVPSQLVVGGELATEPTAPADANHTFIGWFTDAACTQAHSFETPVTSNMTVYGKWHSNNVTITFDSQNGTTNTTQVIAYGGKVTKPSDPINGDKVFAG